jgi:hypothetical protein
MPTSVLPRISSRGPVSAWLLSRRGPTPRIEPRQLDGLGDDVQLALYLCYEPHFNDVPWLAPGSEWDPAVIGLRRALESAFLRSLHDLVGQAAPQGPAHEVIPALIDADDGPSVSRYMETEGALHEMRDAVKHRSAYQLKEADPHTIAIPHLRGRAKQILAEIQAGEYGADEPDRAMHSDLFAQTMRGLGLDDRPNAYLDELPASALLISNLISLFGFDRARRGCLVGHLTVFEMTSVVPMGRYARGLQRMGASDEARRFYEVHVLADAEHELLALQMASALEHDEPRLRDDIVFGARCVLATERLFADDLFRLWRTGPRRGARAA